MAFKSISMKKTRSFLTMLGIIIGVASVVIMVSVVQGQNQKNMEYFEKMGDNKITVYAYSYYDTNNETSQKLYDYCLSLRTWCWASPPTSSYEKRSPSSTGPRPCGQRLQELADDWASHAHQAGLRPVRGVQQLHPGRRPGAVLPGHGKDQPVCAGGGA
ncbi:MAG: ABC transporter permease [Lawsonibacter sp.]